MHKNVGFLHKDAEIEQNTLIFIWVLKEIEGQYPIFARQNIYFYFAVAVFSLCAFT